MSFLGGSDVLGDGCLGQGSRLVIYRDGLHLSVYLVSANALDADVSGGRARFLARMGCAAGVLFRRVSICCRESSMQSRTFIFSVIFGMGGMSAVSGGGCLSPMRAFRYGAGSVAANDRRTMLRLMLSEGGGAAVFLLPPDILFFILLFCSLSFGHSCPHLVLTSACALGFYRPAR